MLKTTLQSDLVQRQSSESQNETMIVKYQISNMDTSPHQMAIEALEACADIHKVAFLIQRKGNDRVNGGLWIIKTMGQKFIDKEFIKAAGDTVVFIDRAFAKTPKDSGGG